MDLWITYLLFCALPLLLAWLAIVGSLVLIFALSDRGARPARPSRPTGGLEQVLERWKAPAGGAARLPDDGGTR
jgi:hypothetical protein